MEAATVRVCERIALFATSTPRLRRGFKRTSQPDFCRPDAAFTAYVLEWQF